MAHKKLVTGTILSFSCRFIVEKPIQETHAGHVQDWDGNHPGLDIAPGLRARWRLRHAFRFPPRDSKRVGKFAVDASARREALDMYPRERRKPTDAAKSPARFERNAWRICTANSTLPSYTKKFVFHWAKHVSYSRKTAPSRWPIRRLVNSRVIPRNNMDQTPSAAAR